MMLGYMVKERARASKADSIRKATSDEPVRRLLLAFGMLLGMSLYSAPSWAALTVEPITWNVIGLDSNSPNTGPNRFPVGARVCNTAASATDVTADFVWDDGQGIFVGDANADPYINLRGGSAASLGLGSIPANGCADAYFEVEVTKDPNAYDNVRAYHITGTDISGNYSTPTPRELYVERLISQNRNAVTKIKLDGVLIPAGGAMSLVVGNTYTITLQDGTATQGYNQFEAFINFRNTIFEILSVRTTYSAKGAALLERRRILMDQSVSDT